MADGSDARRLDPARLPVVVSIATIPSRIGQMRPTLDSLLAGTHAPDLILVNTPHYCELEKSGYDLPDFLTDPTILGGRVRHAFIDKDWGPGTKILGPLPHLPPDSILVIADDDILYHPEFLQHLIAAQVKDLSRAYSYFSYRRTGLRVGQGCDGLSIWSPHLADMQAFADAHVAGTTLVYHDDIWISFFLMSRGIKIARVPLPAGASLIYQQVLPNTVLATQSGVLERERILATHLPRLLREVRMPASTRLAFEARNVVDRVADLWRRVRWKLGLLEPPRPIAAGAADGITP